MPPSNVTPSIEQRVRRPCVQYRRRMQPPLMLTFVQPCDAPAGPCCGAVAGTGNVFGMKLLLETSVYAGGGVCMIVVVLRCGTVNLVVSPRQASKVLIGLDYLLSCSAETLTRSSVLLSRRTML